MAQPPNIASLRPDAAQELQPSMFSLPHAPESTLVGHDGCVNALTWSSDGTLLFSGSDDLHIGVWRVNEVAFPTKRHPSSDLSMTARHSSPLRMVPTAHRGNILSVAVPASNHTCCVSAAIDGTVACTNVQTSTSTLLYDPTEDSAHNGFGRERMAQHCEYVEGSEHVFLVAIQGAVRLFDVRTPSRVVGTVCKSGTFGTGPRHLVYYHVNGGVAVADMRMSRGNPLDEEALWTSDDVRSKGVSGIDVSQDGSRVAISFIDESMFLLTTRTRGLPMVQPCDVVGVSKFNAHKNSDTFLKKPALMEVNQHIWVGHGSDCGQMFLYEGPSVGPRRFQRVPDKEDIASSVLLDCDDTGIMTALDPRANIHAGSAYTYETCRRHTRRKVDQRICNVVAPHPSLQCHRHYAAPSMASGINIIACSGLSSDIKVLRLEDDNRPRIGPNFANDFNDMLAAPLPPAASPTIDGRTESPLLAHMVNIKAKASLAFGQKRLALALELYTQMGTLAYATLHRSDACPRDMLAIISTLWGNAALTASRLDMHHVVLTLCSGIERVNPSEPKAFYRRACALRSLGDLDGALRNAQRGSAMTQRTDGVVEALVSSLAAAHAVAAEKTKRQYAKMFS